MNLALEILRIYRRLPRQDWDLDAVFGFDDDAWVLNRILEVIGRSDLRIAI